MNFYGLVREMENGTTTLENSLPVPQMLHIILPYYPAILLLGIYLENKTYICPRKNLYQMFIAALLIKPKSRRPKISSTETKKILYIPLIKCYLAIKVNKSLYVTTW